MDPSDRAQFRVGGFTIDLFEVLALINAQDAAPACRIVEELTTVIEPSLPLLVVEPTPPTWPPAGPSGRPEPPSAGPRRLRHLSGVGQRWMPSRCPTGSGSASAAR